MKLPKSLNILGQDIALKQEDLDGMYGCFDYINKTISINVTAHTLYKENVQATLIHEIIHAISKRVGLNQSISLAMEEVICESISNCLTDNFDLVIKKKKK